MSIIITSPSQLFCANFEGAATHSLYPVIVETPAPDNWIPDQFKNINYAEVVARACSTFGEHCPDSLLRVRSHSKINDRLKWVLELYMPFSSPNEELPQLHGIIAGKALSYLLRFPLSFRVLAPEDNYNQYWCEDTDPATCYKH